jgi:hypothetical protein
VNIYIHSRQNDILLFVYYTMTFTKEHIALTIIGAISVTALILWIVGVASNGRGCRWDRIGTMGNQRMMQQDFQQRGNIMRQRFNTNETGSIQNSPVQTTPAEIRAE